MKIQMKLLSDAIFGNGVSVPGGEDISVLSDQYGFPYYKGGTLKGIFREELERYLSWTMKTKEEAGDALRMFLGENGDREILNSRKIIFSDFQLSDAVKSAILEEIGTEQKEQVLDSLSHIRTFTSISEDGTVEEGSLRNCRCINQGLYFYSEVQCAKKDQEMVRDVLAMIKWIGTMRNRGFGHVQITAVSRG